MPKPIKTSSQKSPKITKASKEIWEQDHKNSAHMEQVKTTGLSGDWAPDRSVFTVRRFQKVWSKTLSNELQKLWNFYWRLTRGQWTTPQIFSSFGEEIKLQHAPDRPVLTNRQTNPKRKIPKPIPNTSKWSEICMGGLWYIRGQLHKISRQLELV